MRRPLRRSEPALVLLLSAAFFVAAVAQIPPSPSQWVTDTAGFLSPQTVESLNSELQALADSSGRQVLVYIGKTTAGIPLEDFATKVFNSWKPGRKGLDDGLILFIFSEDKKIKIEVGYGLEDKIPDIVAGRIINDVLIPKIQAADPDGAVRDAVRAIERALGADASAEPVSKPEFRKAGVFQTIGIIIAIVVFLIIFITNPRLALWLLFNILSGGRGGGFGGGGGGGFRGGGGRSGGGGASGGW